MEPITLGLPELYQAICRLIADIPLTQKADTARQLLRFPGERTLLDIAERNEIVPHLAHVLCAMGETEELSAIWSGVHQATQKRISSYMSELDRLAECLADNKIPLAALKNGSIARDIYSCIGCCPMGDIDALVSKADFRAAHAILVREGYQHRSRSILEETPDLAQAEAAGGAEYLKILPDGLEFWFELQWRPVAGRWIRTRQEPGAEDLLARSSAIPGTVVRLLAPEDNLLQVALHVAKHSYVRAPGLRLHTDVDRIVRAYPGFDWNLFCTRAELLEVKTPVYFSLVIPKLIFETPIPEAVLNRLCPPRWKERLLLIWLRRAGLFNAAERKFSRPGYILFNALLYDDLSELWQAIFPDAAWMRQRFAIRQSWLLPFYHLRRLADLTFRRTRT